jgi:hypothetical protein
MIREDAAAVTRGAIPAERLRADLPTFCEPILNEDDPAQAVGINFWPERLNDCARGDDHLAAEVGELFGQEAIWFIRNRHGPALLTAVLIWMGERLQRERRCPGPLERGFLDRIKADCPDVVDAVVMEHFRQNPQQLN